MRTSDASLLAAVAVGVALAPVCLLPPCPDALSLEVEGAVVKAPDFVVIGTPDAEGRMGDGIRGQLLAHLRKYAGKALEIRIRPYKAKRSSPQNRRHFALMTVGAKSLWEDPGERETLHDELAHLYFGLPPCPKTGMRRRRRTPNTNTKEFAEFTDWCAMKLIELGADLSEWDAETERLRTAA